LEIVFKNPYCRKALTLFCGLFGYTDVSLWFTITFADHFIENIRIQISVIKNVAFSRLPRMNPRKGRYDCGFDHSSPTRRE